MCDSNQLFRGTGNVRKLFRWAEGSNMPGARLILICFFAMFPIVSYSYLFTVYFFFIV